jgi:hypothetical protein
MTPPHGDLAIVETGRHDIPWKSIFCLGPNRDPAAPSREHPPKRSLSRLVEPLGAMIHEYLSRFSTEFRSFGNLSCPTLPDCFNLRKSKMDLNGAFLVLSDYVVYFVKERFLDMNIYDDHDVHSS